MDVIMQAAEGDKRSTHWSRIEERGVYLGLYLTFRVYRLFGRRVFSIFLYPVIAYFVLLSRTARHASHVFLARVHAHPHGRQVLGRRPGWRESFRHFLSFAEALLDKLAAWMGDIRLSDITYENREIFTELERSGKGGVLIGSHLGNIEVCRALGSLSRNLRINVLVHTKHSRNFNRLMRAVNPDSGVSLIQTTEIGPDTAIMLRDRVARGEFIVIVGDRVPVSGTQRNSRVQFLGHPALFPRGPLILASLVKCPTQLIFCLKQEGRYHIIFEHFADEVVLPRKSRSEALDRLVTRYVARLEHYCVRYPYQWFNFFDFWARTDAISSRSDAVDSSRS